MRLLIITQKVDADDPILGFFHRWIEEFAKQCERVLVLCLEQGNFHLPQNVSVASLGKERQRSKPQYVARFYRYIFAHRREYDCVFVHMNPEYVLLGSFLWRIWRKRIGLWYVHRQVNMKLRIAEKLSHVIFTAAKESFQLKSGKVHVLGHGIDTKKFFCADPKMKNKEPLILSVGRITKIKNLETLVRAAGLVKTRIAEKFVVRIIGDAVTAEDRALKTDLERQIFDNGLAGTVVFMGSAPHGRMPEVYCSADLSVNLAPTGGLDKAVLESMACGVPAFSSNRAFAPLFGPLAPSLLFRHGDPEDLAEKITRFFAASPSGIGARLRQSVIAEHDIASRVSDIAGLLDDLA